MERGRGSRKRTQPQHTRCSPARAYCGGRQKASRARLPSRGDGEESRQGACVVCVRATRPRALPGPAAAQNLVFLFTPSFAAAKSVCNTRRRGVAILCISLECRRCGRSRAPCLGGRQVRFCVFWFLGFSFLLSLNPSLFLPRRSRPLTLHTQPPPAAGSARHGTSPALRWSSTT